MIGIAEQVVADVFNYFAIPMLYEQGVAIDDLAEWADITSPDVRSILEEAGSLEPENVDHA